MWTFSYLRTIDDGNEGLVLMFFANTGVDTFWELKRTIQLDHEAIFSRAR